MLRLCVPGVTASLIILRGEGCTASADILEKLQLFYLVSFFSALVCSNVDDGLIASIPPH